MEAIIGILEDAPRHGVSVIIRATVNRADKAITCAGRHSDASVAWPSRRQCAGYPDR